MEASDARDQVTLRSRGKWFWIAFAITVVAPVGGVILGFTFLSEPDLRREGKLIVPLAIVWTIVTLYFISRIIAPAGGL